jgi:hypothetical protein
MSKDLAASVRARLLNLARAEGTDFNQILVRYALERFLYRLSKSAHADRFMLKGALLSQSKIAEARYGSAFIGLLAGRSENPLARSTHGVDLDARLVRARRRAPESWARSRPKAAQSCWPSKRSGLRECPSSDTGDRPIWRRYLSRRDGSAGCQWTFVANARAEQA